MLTKRRTFSSARRGIARQFGFERLVEYQQQTRHKQTSVQIKNMYSHKHYIDIKCVYICFIIDSVLHYGNILKWLERSARRLS
jgi:hypothetical protein